MFIHFFSDLISSCRREFNSGFARVDSFIHLVASNKNFHVSPRGQWVNSTFRLHLAEMQIWCLICFSYSSACLLYIHLRIFTLELPCGRPAHAGFFSARPHDPEGSIKQVMCFPRKVRPRRPQLRFLISCMSACHQRDEDSTTAAWLCYANSRQTELLFISTNSGKSRKTVRMKMRNWLTVNSAQKNFFF